MGITELERMKNGVLLLERSISESEKEVQILNEMLKNKKAMNTREKKYLEVLKSDYYNAYFATERKDFTKLTDIPEPVVEMKNPLSFYSTLNVDEVCKMICLLFDEYEQKEMQYKRLYLDPYKVGSSTIFKEPYIAIGEPAVVNDGVKSKDNIIILWKAPLECVEVNCHNIDVYNPVSVFYKDIDEEEFNQGGYHSNYQPLISSFVQPYVDKQLGDLIFNYKGYEFIRELIYNLAYYQKMHNIRLMSGNETWDVFRKIYKK